MCRRDIWTQDSIDFVGCSSLSTKLYPGLLSNRTFPTQWLHETPVVVYRDTNFPRREFLKISEGLAHLNFEEFCIMRNIYMATAKENNENYDSAGVDDFYENVLFSFPSNDQIMNLFLNLFNRNKHLYEKNMENLKETTLSCYHIYVKNFKKHRAC